MRMTVSAASLLTGLCAAATIAATFGVSAQQPAAQGAGAGQARGGGAGGGGAAPTTESMLWTAFDSDKNGAVTRTEVKNAFGSWYTGADAAKAGSVTVQQLGEAITKAIAPAAAPPAAAPAEAAGAAGAGAGAARGAAGGGGRAATPFVAGATTPGLNAPCGGRSQTPTVPCVGDVQAMLAALPASAPAKAATPHKVLAFSRIPSSGYQHSSIPLAIKTVEEMGKKYGAWTTDVSWDPKSISAESLKQYDAIFLSNTTGCFLDDATDPEGTLARRKAFVEFVRSGKGVAGIHATGDSYHGGGGNCVPDPTIPAAGAAAAGGRGGGGRGGAGGGPGGSLAPVILRWSWGLNDKKLQANDQTLTKADMDAVADGWYSQLDPGNAGMFPKSDFDYRIVPVITQSNSFVGSAGRDSGRGSWTDWDNMIGGWFKFHWLDPQHIVVKIDDKGSPITKMFNGADFDVNDETYTFSVNSFSRENVHVLTSINYDKMSFMDKLKESNPRPDHDFGLSWIKKEGQGRVFYMALGHDERIYSMPNMMAHLLAGMQYTLGDLKADDSPSKKK